MDGMILSMLEDGMTLGITDMADGTEDGTTLITDTCTRTTLAGTEDGTHIGATTTITTST